MFIYFHVRLLRRVRVMISAVSCQPEFPIADQRVERVERVGGPRLVSISCRGVTLDKKLYATLSSSTQLNKKIPGKLNKNDGATLG